MLKLTNQSIKSQCNHLETLTMICIFFNTFSRDWKLNQSSTSPSCVHSSLAVIIFLSLSASTMVTTFIAWADILKSVSTAYNLCNRCTATLIDSTICDAFWNAKYICVIVKKYKGINWVCLNIIDFKKANWSVTQMNNQPHYPYRGATSSGLFPLQFLKLFFQFINWWLMICFVAIDHGQPQLQYEQSTCDVSTLDMKKKTYFYISYSFINYHQNYI